ncbi:MAG: YraN family protein, partial [Pyrinomonadaceae bacterium]
MNSSPENSQTSPEHFELGRRGEELAAAYLQQAGYRLVASNFTVPVGRNRNDALINVEIDLVAYEGPVLCFIEVKTRTSDWFAAPSANVDLRKQRQITRAARAYRRMLGLVDEVYRFDVVSVLLPPNSTDFEIELTRNFWSEEKFRPFRRPEAY